MRVEAWDADFTSADDLIGKFVSTKIPISSTSAFQSVKLSNQDVTSYNSEVRQVKRFVYLKVLTRDTLIDLPFKN